MNITDFKDIFNSAAPLDSREERHRVALGILLEGLVLKSTGMSTYFGQKLQPLLQALNVEFRSLLRLSAKAGSGIDVYAVSFQGEVAAVLTRDTSAGDEVTLIDRKVSLALACYIAGLLMVMLEEEENALPAATEVPDTALFPQSNLDIYPLDRGSFLLSSCDLLRLQDLSRRYSVFVVNDKLEIRAVQEIRSVAANPRAVRVLTLDGELEMQMAEAPDYLVFSLRKAASSTDFSDLQARIQRSSSWTAALPAPEYRGGLGQVEVTQHFNGRVRPAHGLVYFFDAAAAEQFVERFAGENAGILEQGMPQMEYNEFRDGIHWVMTDLPARQRPLAPEEQPKVWEPSVLASVDGTSYLR